MTTPVIIEAAINGATTRDVNPNVAMTPEEIAADALATLAAGASIIHTHCNPVGGPAEEVAQRYLASYELVWKEKPGALIYPTINFSADGLNFDHLPYLAQAGLRVGLLDPGSVNLGRAGDEGVPASGFVYANSFDTIAATFALHNEHRLGMSFAIYEPGFLRTAMAYERAGQMPAGSMIKLYFAPDDGTKLAPFGLPPTVTALDAYLEILDGSSLHWAVSIFGGDIGRSDLARVALERGGHLHLGLEFHGGDRTPTNVELVNEAVELCAEAGRPVASHDETVELLGLPAV